jgi:hypothetical protein
MSKRNELKARIHYVVLHSLLIVVGDAPGQRPACPERLPLASCNSYSRTVWRNTQRGCVVTQSQGMGLGVKMIRLSGSSIWLAGSFRGLLSELLVSKGLVSRREGAARYMARRGDALRNDMD